METLCLAKGHVIVARETFLLLVRYIEEKDQLNWILSTLGSLHQYFEQNLLRDTGSDSVDMEREGKIVELYFSAK